MTGGHREWLGGTTGRLATLVTLVGVGVVSVMSRGPRWLGSWKLALDEAGGSVFLIGPVAAGIACAVYVRLRLSHVDDLLSQAARPWRGWITPALGVWASASSAVVLIGIAVTTGAWLAGATPYPHCCWVLLPALTVLGAEVAVGALVGARLQRYWAVPWVAVSTYLLFLLTRFDVVPVVFDTGPTSGELIGETFSPPWFVYQAVVSLGIGAAALAASHHDLFRLSSLPLKALTGVAVGAAVITFVAVESPAERYELSPQQADVCRGDRPVVCMTKDGHRPLDDLASRMTSLTRPLVEAGVRLPDRFVPIESSSAADSGVGIVTFVDDEELAAEVDDAVAARALAAPTRCAAYSADEPPPEQYFSTHNFLVLWLLVQSGDEDAPTDGPLMSWWALPVVRQYPWLRATYAALTECRLADLALPEPPDPPSAG